MLPFVFHRERLDSSLRQAATCGSASSAADRQRETVVLKAAVLRSLVAFERAIGSHGGGHVYIGGGLLLVVLIIVLLILLF